jgi:hypothetical protein
MKEQYRQDGDGSETVYVGTVFVRVAFRLECYGQRNFSQGSAKIVHARETTAKR